MADESNTRQFGYRLPRAAVPYSVRIEILGNDGENFIRVRGIDISASGIAIALTEPIQLNEAVELAIHCRDGEIARIRGQVSHQSEDRFGLEFAFKSADERRPIEDLVAQIIKTV